MQFRSYPYRSYLNNIKHINSTLCMFVTSICLIGVCRQLAINFYYIWAHGHFPHWVPSNINIFRIWFSLHASGIKYIVKSAFIVRYTKICVEMVFLLKIVLKVVTKPFIYVQTWYVWNNIWKLLVIYTSNHGKKLTNNYMNITLWAAKL